MSKNKFVNIYLKLSIIFGILGWVTLFIAAGLAAFHFYMAALYMGVVSIVVGWFVFGYCVVMYGISQGKNVKQIIKERVPWYKTRKRWKGR